MAIDRVAVTCEHGGNVVPAGYRALFRGAARVLRTHRGFDPGALRVARDVSAVLGAPLHASTVTRLLIDLNRSLGHPSCFSEFSARLDAGAKAAVVRRYYAPYRAAVEKRLDRWLAKGLVVLHLSVHSFTPVLRGVRRRGDIGLLYDPRRAGEKRFCRDWLGALRGEAPGLRVRRNYPYLGRSDGFTTALRGRYPANRYLGVELEMNQRLLLAAASEARVRRAVTGSLQALLGAGVAGR